MIDSIKFKKGIKNNLPILNLAEPGLTTDEERLYIGGNNGNIPLPNKSDITNINTQLAQIPNQTYITEKMKTVDANNALTLKTDKTTTDNLQSQLNNISINVSNYYDVCLSTDSNALIIVSSGAATGQINLSDVTPHLSTYIPAVGNYVRKLSQGLTAEIEQAKVDSNSRTYDTLKSRLDEKDYITFRRQYLKVANWTTGRYYNFNGLPATYTTDVNYRTHTPITLKAGTYYISAKGSTGGIVSVFSRIVKKSDSTVIILKNFLRLKQR